MIMAVGFTAVSWSWGTSTVSRMDTTNRYMQRNGSAPTRWRKSSRSSQETNCVEVGAVGDGAAVRDTKDRAAGHFEVDGARWSAFLTQLKSGRFDL